MALALFGLGNKRFPGKASLADRRKASFYFGPFFDFALNRGHLAMASESGKVWTTRMNSDYVLVPPHAATVLYGRPASRNSDRARLGSSYSQLIQSGLHIFEWNRPEGINPEFNFSQEGEITLKFWSLAVESMAGVGEA